MLKGEQDLAADALGVVEGLESGCEGLPFRMTEVGRSSTEGENEVVVGKTLTRAGDEPLVGADGVDLPKMNLDIGKVAKNGADRLGDLGRGSTAQALHTEVVAGFQAVGDELGRTNGLVWLGFVAEHPETLEQVYLTTNSGRIEAMSFVAPVAYTLDWLMLFSDKNKVLTFSVVSVLGVVFGSAVWALVSRSFRWEGFGGTEDVANHLVGAVLMGVGECRTTGESGQE